MTDTQHSLKSVYELIGEAAIERLIAAFYRRVKTDPVLRPLYPEHDLAGAERRLRLFVIQYFGGPPQYSAERGHPRLRMRHAPYAIGQVERDAWLSAMLAALDEAQIASLPIAKCASTSRTPRPS
jgi:hemoglobin